MISCPVCTKEFDEKTGRRPKKFCSDACKIKFWNNQKKGTDKTILDATKPSHEVKPHEQPKTNYVIDTERIAELEEEFAAIPDKTKGLGKALAKSIQDKIYNLKYPKQ